MGNFCQLCGSKKNNNAIINTNAKTNNINKIHNQTSTRMCIGNDKSIIIYRQRIGQCQICFNNNEQLITLSSKCEHSADHCYSCIKKDIQANICHKGVRRVKCMFTNCHTIYESHQFYPMLDTKYLGIVDKLDRNAALENMSEFRWCKNPKGCGSGQLVSNYKSLAGYYHCNECRQEMCFKHDMVWHSGYDCKEFDDELKNNPGLASDNLILQFCKQCPKCGTKIVKLEGCDVMRCCRFGTHGCHDAIKEFNAKCDHGGRAYCGQLFCWRCLGLIQIDCNNGGRYIRHCKPQCQYSDLND